MKTRKGLAVLLWLATIVLSACAKYQSVLPPDVGINRDHTKAYEMVVILKQNPNDIVRATAKVSYRITNTDCVPVDYGRSIGGSRPIFQEVKNASVGVEGETYIAVFHEDLLEDEDYYGLGICHWHVEGISMLLHRGGVANVISIPLLQNQHHRGKFESERCMFRSVITQRKNAMCMPVSAPKPREPHQHFIVAIETRRHEK